MIIGFSLYVNTLKVPFFWDDNDNVVNNVYVKDSSYWKKYFTDNLIAGSGLYSNYYRPFLLLALALLYKMFELRVEPWHVFNILLHVSNSFLLFLFLCLLVRRRLLPLLVSLVFLIHPIQTEAIAMITATADPLFFLFYLIAANIYSYFGKNPWGIGLTALFFIFSLLSKELAITFPVILFLAELLKVDRGFFRNFWRALKRTVLFWVIAIAYFLFRLTVLNFYLEQTDFSRNIVMRLYTWLDVLYTYFNLLLYPQNLHSMRLILPISSISLRGLVAAVLTLLMIFFSVKRLKENRLYAFGCLWFFATLLPTSNIIIPINSIMFEHWLYVPMVGFFIFLFCLFRESIDFVTLRYSESVKSRFKEAMSIIFLMYAAFLGFSTVTRNKDWQDPIIFFEKITKFNPSSILVWNNLGMNYAEKGHLEKAVESYKRAIELDKENKSAPPHHNLGNSYLALGRVEEAEQEFRKAIQIDKDFVYSYKALYLLYGFLKKEKETREILEQYNKVLNQVYQ